MLSVLCQSLAQCLAPSQCSGDAPVQESKATPVHGRGDSGPHAQTHFPGLEEADSRFLSWCYSDPSGSPGALTKHTARSEPALWRHFEIFPILS